MPKKLLPHQTKTSSSKILVGILMGSISDAPLLQETEKVLNDLGVPYDITVASAHRTPDLVRKFILRCEKNGAKVFIAAAGGAAALPGVVAAETTKPVIGIPVESNIQGMDSLLSIVQMPAGIPVATVAIGKAGARNAAHLAAEILGISDPKIAESIKNYRSDQIKKIINDDKKLKTNTPYS